MSTMKAIRLPRFGGADVLEWTDVPIPQPVDDEVLVRVRAASVNPVDYKIRQGGYPMVKQDDLPITLGRDLAGVIEAVGTRAHYMLREGDGVFALIGPDRGAQAEYVVVKAVELVAQPKNLDAVQAAAVPLAAMTAWQGLFTHGGLAPGQRVLVQGAAGGVGHMAVQLAKAKGAHVVATAGADDLDFVRGLGADEAIDYKDADVAGKVGQVDLVFDLVGGETGEKALAMLKPGGVLVSTLEPPDEAKAKETGVRVAPRYHAEPNAEQLGEVAALIEAGEVKVTVAETYPMAEAANAQARQEQGHVRGKIVLTLD